MGSLSPGRLTQTVACGSACHVQGSWEEVCPELVCRMLTGKMLADYPVVMALHRGMAQVGVPTW